MIDSTADSFGARQDILRAWTDRLYSEYEYILYQFNLRLLKPVIRIEPLSRDWGHWNPETRSIAIARRLIEEHPWDVVIEVLKHEMAHQVADERLGGSDGGHTPHGATFQRACSMLGVAELGIGWIRGISAGRAGDFPRADIASSTGLMGAIHRPLPHPLRGTVRKFPEITMGSERGSLPS